MNNSLISSLLLLVAFLSVSCQTCRHPHSCIRQGDGFEYLCPTKISFDMLDADWIFEVEGQQMSAAGIDGLLGKHATKHRFWPDVIFFFGTGMTEPIRTAPFTPFLGDVRVNDQGMLEINGRFESTSLENVIPYMAQVELLRDANSSTIFAVPARYLPESIETYHVREDRARKAALQIGAQPQPPWPWDSPAASCGW